MIFKKQLGTAALATCLTFLGLSTFLSPQFTFAQATSGDVTGTVVDASGAAVGQASVVATNEATGVVFTATSNANGEFRIGNLPAGLYDITGSASGFAKFDLKGLAVSLNQQATARLVLPVAGTSTQIEVSSTAGAAIDTTTAQLGVTFETKELQDLPISSVGLGVLNLSLLSPGVGTSGGIGAGTGPAVGGQRPRNNNFTIEGVDNNDKSVTGPLVQVPNDAVAEFAILTNQFSPEFGHSTGGQFNILVNSGTNKFHGRGYEYFQNRNLDAIDASTKRSGLTKNPRFDNNRFGGQIGGPVLHDKLFFFSNYEQNPIGQTFTGGQCTPTAAGFATLDSINGLSANNYGVFKKYVAPAPSLDTAHAYCTPTDTTAGGTDAVDVVDTAGITHAVEVGVLPTSGPSFSNSYFSTNSVDYTISDKDSFRGRYIYNRIGSLDTAASLPVFWTTIPARYHLIAFSEYHNFSPTLTNEVRVGFNRYYNTTPSGNFSFPGLDSFPNLTFNDLGSLNVGPDGNAPQSTIQNLYQFTDNLTWTKGAHTLKFGFEARKFISPQSFTQRVRGDYQWGTGDSTAPNGLGDYLNDLAPTYFGERSTGDFFYYGDQTAWYGYANDSWRVSPQITLNYGLRYEFTTVPTGERVQKINSAASVPGLIDFAQPKPQKKNVSPRLGIAWAPGKGDWSIRAGFGMGTDVLYDNLGILSFPPQYSSTNDVGNPNSPQPGDPNFLANGGLPKGNGSLQVFPDLLSQREATTGFVPNQTLPYSEQWNFGVQHVFATNYTAEVRYVGTRGIHLTMQNRLNRQATVGADNFLPTFASDPGQSAADNLTKSLSNVKAFRPNFKPDYSAAGFDANSLVSFAPTGASNYNGLQASLSRRFERGLQLSFAYTWSRTMDNSTADVFSTVLTPRRAQDWNNPGADYSRSALDHTHRLTLETVYDVPFLKTSNNWIVKNLVGNWEVAPIYTFQSPEYGDVQSGTDANLNGDAAGDRAILNPNAPSGTGTGVFTLYSSPLSVNCSASAAIDPRSGLPVCGADTVGYAALGNARYISAGSGTLTTVGRNTLALPHINNVDVTAVKRINLTERMSVEFQAQALNVFNHSQYISGSLNQVNSLGDTGAINFLKPSSPQFNQPQLVFSNNARTMQLVGKFTF